MSFECQFCHVSIFHTLITSITTMKSFCSDFIRVLKESQYILDAYQHKNLFSKIKVHHSSLKTCLLEIHVLMNHLISICIPVFVPSSNSYKSLF